MAMLEKTTQPDKRTVGNIGDIWIDVITGMTYKLVAILMGSDEKVWYDWQLIDNTANSGGGGGGSISSEIIKGVLGYTPANQKDIDKLQDAKVVVSNDEPEYGALWIDKDVDEEVILAEIDDKKVSEEMTWSSQKINAMFTEYVDDIAELVGGEA